MLHITIDEKAKIARAMRERVEFVTVTAEPTWPEALRTWLGYTAVAAGVGFAVFTYVEPAHARDVGTMNHEARVVYVSPSVSIYGSKIEQKMKADINRDNNRANNAYSLEQQRSDNRRALEADKAYYKKLSDQRKRK